ncbi:MAG: hypothetical protein ABSH34_31505 [Verrucomicrobiota bacterium]|jgi:folate-dependent phosphoribosylglycinamide formyltransferase PurN
MKRNAEVATVRVPDDAAGHTIHIVLTATDSGHPVLTRYRRVVVIVGHAARGVFEHRP